MIPLRHGWKKEPPKAKDRPAGNYLGSGPVPQLSSNRLLVPDLIVQTNQDCTVNSTAIAVRGSQILQLPTGVASLMPEIFSRRMMYLLMRQACGFGDADDGGYIRGVFDILNKFGFCPESVWPYDKPLNEQPSLEAFREAIDQKNPVEYLKIFETGSARVDHIKRALASKHLVVFGTPISQEMEDLRDATPIKPPVGQTIIGGHAMCLVDHVNDDFRIAQTWGPDFADNGYMHMSADYLAWDQTDDVWIVARAPEFSQ